MKLTLMVIGRTNDPNIKELVTHYLKKLPHYTAFNYVEIAEIKNTKSLSQEQQKNKEGNSVLQRLKASDFVVLLDEKGTLNTSIELANWLQKRLNTGLKHLVFVVGGPYGFSTAVYQRANQKLSLSKLTFSHEMVRLFFVEQLYRAFSILRNEPYHHE